MARRPERRDQEMLSEENLKELRHNLAHLSLPAIESTIWRLRRPALKRLRSTWADKTSAVHIPRSPIFVIRVAAANNAEGAPVGQVIDTARCPKITHRVRALGPTLNPLGSH